MSRFLLFLLCALTTFAFWSNSALAAPADRDLSFGTSGLMNVVLGNVGVGGAPRVMVQPGGKILVSTSWPSAGGSWKPRILRYTAAGVPDKSFGGGDGWVSTSVATLITMDSSGRTVLASRGANTTILTRYTADGVPDTSFGRGGRRTYDIALEGDSERVTGMSFDASGRLLVRTSTYGTFTTYVARLRPDGSLDPTFGGTGIVKVNEAFDGGPVTHDAAGHIYVVSSAGEVIWGNAKYRVDRLESNGAPDLQYAQSGSFEITHNTASQARDAFVDKGGRLVVTGGTTTQSAAMCPCGGNAFVARYSAEGKPDPSFGNGGVAAYNRGDSALQRAFAAPGGGMTLLVTVHDSQSIGSNLILRLRADGTRDESFAPLGEISPGPYLVNGSMSFQADGKFLVAAFFDGHAPDFTQFRMMRFRGDSADVSVASVGATSGTAAVAGEVLTYSVNVRNRGVRTARSARVAIHIPARTRIASVKPSYGRCTRPAPTAGATRRTVWCSLGMISRTGTRRVTLKVKVPRGISSMRATAVARSALADARPANNRRSRVHTIG